MPDALTPEEEAILAEDVEIDVEVRRRILLLHRSLERADHYQLLGVDRSADKKTVKRAYYDLAAKLHPDRYFRKNLGSFKARMEAVFGRLSIAHEMLTDKEKRAEYDAYLEEQRRSRGIEDLLADALAEIKRAEENVEREARAGSGSSSQPGVQAVAAASPVPASPASPAPPPPPKPAGPTVEVSDAARRDALARRLLGGARAPGTSSRPSMPPVTKSPAPPAPQPVPTAADAMEALRHRYELRKTQARDAQARKYVAAAEAALASNDPVSAANAFRVAATLLPDDAAVQQRAAETQQRADQLLADTYAKQAAYEEKVGQWTEAARSWQRVCKGRPNDAHAAERAANAMVKAGGDLHEASRLAQQACAMRPNDPSYRVTLANVYLAAGLALNARRELETAAQRAPHDDTIQAMLKRVAKSA